MENEHRTEDQSDINMKYENSQYNVEVTESELEKDIKLYLDSIEFHETKEVESYLKQIESEEDFMET